MKFALELEDIQRLLKGNTHTFFTEDGCVEIFLGGNEEEHPVTGKVSIMDSTELLFELIRRN